MVFINVYKRRETCQNSSIGFLFLFFSRFKEKHPNLRSRNVRSVFDFGLAIIFLLFAAAMGELHQNNIFEKDEL